jgi:L-ascorbate metabolism protein UlaG (beta-lactamase superfamily)
VSATNDAPGVRVTRIVNACVLVELDGVAVLTDPWFTERWHFHWGEELGMTVAELPPLAGILVSNSFLNHWDVRALRSYASKASTPVLVPGARMVRQARAAGFPHAERVGWGETRQLTPALGVDVVEAHTGPLGRTNSYVLTGPAGRVLIGGEARTLAPLQAYASEHEPVDVALLPVNGLTVPGGRRIVMNPVEAVAGAGAVGARVLVPIHDAMAPDPLWALVRRRGTAADAVAHARSIPDAPEVVVLPTGQTWSSD